MARISASKSEFQTVQGIESFESENSYAQPAQCAGSSKGISHRVVQIKRPKTDASIKSPRSDQKKYWIYL